MDILQQNIANINYTLKRCVYNGSNSLGNTSQTDSIHFVLSVGFKSSQHLWHPEREDGKRLVIRWDVCWQDACRLDASRRNDLLHQLFFAFWSSGSQALGICVCNIESWVRLYSICNWGSEKTTVRRPGVYCMKVWSMVVLLLKRELNSLLLCLLVCNLEVYCVLVLLVVMEWTATITGDHMVLFLDFSIRRKI